MRLFLIVLSFTFAILSFTSCDQLKGLMGDKKAEEQKKLEEIASQMAQKMMEQQKKEAEEKAKQAQEIEAEVQKRLAALQAETQAQQAPQTQPTTQPTEKIIEKIIIKEQVPATDKKAAKLSGYVKLYEHKGNFGNSYTLSFGRNSPDTDHVLNDQRSTNFKDNCSSATYKIPAGWRVSLYEHTHYRGRAYTLTGSGSVSDLGFMNDKCSSVRWEQ